MTMSAGLLASSLCGCGGGAEPPVTVRETAPAAGSKTAPDAKVGAGAPVREEDVKRWIEQLNSASGSERDEAIQRLGRLKRGDDEIVEALIAALPRLEFAQRKLVVNALGRIGAKSSKVVPILIRVLEKDSHPQVRNEAVDMLERIGPPAAAAVPALSYALRNDELDQTRWDAAEALQSIGPAAKSAVPALIAALRDKSSKVRAKSASALKSLDREAAKKAGIP